MFLVAALILNGFKEFPMASMFARTQVFILLSSAGLPSKILLDKISYNWANLIRFGQNQNLTSPTAILLSNSNTVYYLSLQIVNLVS